MITHEEYKNICDTTDVSHIKQFNQVEVSKVDTYLTELIGADMVAKLKAGSYTELIPNVKKCLAWEIHLHFVTIGNVQVAAIGAVDRQSDFSRKPEFVDKKNKIDAVTKILRGYESVLIAQIEDGDYKEAESSSTLSSSHPFYIFGIGD
jgi:hypothetical protein